MSIFDWLTEKVRRCVTTGFRKGCDDLETSGDLDALQERIANRRQEAEEGQGNGHGKVAPKPQRITSDKK